MVAGLREREQIRDLFGRQVGHDVAHEALATGVDLGGVECEIAVINIWPVNCRVCPLGKVMLMSLVSVPSISLCLMLFEVIDSLGDPIFQLSNRGFVVGKF